MEFKDFLFDAVLTGWPDGHDVGWKQKNSKTRERYFFVLSLSLLTKSWCTSSHESFKWFLPVKGHDIPMFTSRLWPWDPALSVLDELFTDWWYSAEHWTAAGSWKAMANLSLRQTCIIAVNKSWWTDLLIVTHCPCPHRLHDPHLLKSIHSCSSVASKGLTFKRGLFVTSLSIKLCSLITLFL